MEEKVLKKFQEEIEFQCKLVLFALDDLKKALGDYDKAYVRGLGSDINN